MSDMISFQTAFNIMVGACGALIGWLMTMLYRALKDLQLNDKELTDKVQGMEVLVVGQYIKRSEFEAKIDALFKKLDHIEELLRT